MISYKKIFISFCLSFVCYLLSNYFPIIKVFFNQEFLQEIINIWLSILKSLCGPLVFCFTSLSFINLFKNSNTNRQEIRKFSFLLFFSFFFSSFISILLGLFGGKFIFHLIGLEKIDLFYNPNSSVGHHDILSLFLNLIPKSFINPFIEANFLHIIVIAIIFSLSLKKINENKLQGHNIVKSIEYMLEIFKASINIILQFLPLILFSIIFIVLSTQSILMFRALLKLIFVEIVLQFLLIYIFYAFLIKIFTKQSLKYFFNTLFPAQLLAFITASSAATLSILMDIFIRKLKLDEKKIGFSIPLSITINMNGTIIHFGSVLAFAIIISGTTLDAYEYISIILYSLLSSFAVGPVPGGSIILIGTLLKEFNLPVEILPLILSVDRILESFRTATNISSNSVINFILLKNK